MLGVLTGRKHSVRGVLTEGIKFSSALMIERSASSSRSRMHDFQFAAWLQPNRLQRAPAAAIKVASRAAAPAATWCDATIRTRPDAAAVHLVGDRRFADQLGRVECQATAQQPLLAKLAEAATLQQTTFNVATSDK